MNELDNLLSAMKINDEDSLVSIRLKHLRRVQGDSCQPDYERLQSDKLASMLIPSEINPHRYDNPKDYFKQQFFEAFEQAVGTLENRFEQKNMTIVKEIESLLLNAANGELFSVSEEIAMLYKDDISFPRLEQQLKMLPDIFKVDSENEIKKVTLIDTICQHMKEPITKKLLSEVTKLVQIYLTIPVTTATPERSFSSLRRIKTYLRSTMTQARLNHCMTCFVHKERTDQVNIKEIAKSFIQKIPSRKLYFGNY